VPEAPDMPTISRAAVLAIPALVGSLLEVVPRRGAPFQ